MQRHGPFLLSLCTPILDLENGADIRFIQAMPRYVKQDIARMYAQLGASKLNKSYIYTPNMSEQDQ